MSLAQNWNSSLYILIWNSFLPVHMLVTNMVEDATDAKTNEVYLNPWQSLTQ